MEPSAKEPVDLCDSDIILPVPREPSILESSLLGYPPQSPDSELRTSAFGLSPSPPKGSYPPPTVPGDLLAVLSRMEEAVTQVGGTTTASRPRGEVDLRASDKPSMDPSSQSTPADQPSTSTRIAVILVEPSSPATPLTEPKPTGRSSTGRVSLHSRHHTVRVVSPPRPGSLTTSIEFEDPLFKPAEPLTEPSTEPYEFRPRIDLSRSDRPVVKQQHRVVPSPHPPSLRTAPPSRKSVVLLPASSRPAQPPSHPRSLSHAPAPSRRPRPPRSARRAGRVVRSTFYAAEPLPPNPPLAGGNKTQYAPSDDVRGLLMAARKQWLRRQALRKANMSVDM
eukprot:gnl/Dysnectes_brevis/10205_a19873_143.p1 GENE.gnl/Dysnectes_brevis/10205_a19873_143~~gnl/Dysnectes_brevis/10205_a19873_143.p1  ORF type:complete len:336 (-),score=68.64 gnl/Dysnectes_brevis/10205_a19873_143:124-1131(-)